MRSRGLIAVASIALGLAWHGGRAAAQTAPPGNPPAPHHGLFGRRHPSSATAGSRVPFAGAIIGNKRTHVYHLPGEKGTLPAEKNRVYFHSVAEARAAGYHPAGQHPTSPKGAPHPAAVHSRTLSGKG